MGVPGYTLSNFQNKRLYSTVLFEDIPRMFIPVYLIF